MIRFLFALLALTMTCAQPPAIGEDTILLLDAGYYPQKGAPYVHLPTRVRVIGYYEPDPKFIVCVKEKDHSPYGQFYIIRKDLRPGKDEDKDSEKTKIIKLGHGELSPMDDSETSVPIRE